MPIISPSHELAIHHSVPMPNSQCGACMFAQGFGTWQAPKGQCYESVKCAIKAGYRLIDCAKIYRNQEEVGQAIKECIDEGICLRKELFIVSKVWNTDHAPDHVAASTAITIKLLQCEYLDLLLIHCPTPHEHPATGIDDISDNAMFPKNEDGSFKCVDIPAIDTWNAMEMLVTSGKVKDIGLSNFSKEEVTALLEHKPRIKPVALQVEVHPALPQEDLIAFCHKNGIVVMAYCPLGIGMGDASQGVLNNAAFQQIAEDEFKSQPHNPSDPASKTGMAARLMLRWSSQIGCVCLSKSVTPARVTENAATPYKGISDKCMEAVKAFSKDNKVRVCNPSFSAGGKSVFN